MTRPSTPVRRKRCTLAAAALISVLVLAGCASPPAATPTDAGSSIVEGGILEAHELAGLDTTQIIERLDTMPVVDRPVDLIASVRPDALILTDDEQGETRLPMPRDEVYVSIAPYQDQTHDCYFHSLTTCLGELTNADVQVTLTGEDGSVLVNETRQTYDNGFIGFWVPRGIKATLEIQYEGKSGVATVSTIDEGDPTCITTMQLA